MDTYFEQSSESVMVLSEHAAKYFGYCACMRKRQSHKNYIYIKLKKEEEEEKREDI